MDLLAGLFRSRTRAAVLRVLFADTGREWHVRGLAREVGDSPGNVRRELLRLSEAGYLQRRAQANLVLYRLNESHPLYPELHGLVSKTVGAQRLLGEALAGVAGVRLAFLYGSLAAQRERAGSDVDVMILGSPSVRDVHAALRPLEGELRREINYVVFSEDEFTGRIRERDGYVLDVLAGPIVMLVGEEAALRELRRAGEEGSR